MAEKDEQPEVIDPEDPRYKDDTYFQPTHSNQQKSDFENQRRIKYYSFGGCFPIGCGCLPILIILSFLITWLLNLMN
ncbi:hypothetical protein [Staphylococcus carnosus]|uniref:Uncharacterized protein n=1 Tax=Staphylococcus carnosus TaxID=1281 RepID=A0AAJ0JPM7_STACA|nr:hypothetical protein [Staphylococcus carnosus]KKB25012.1 hypothetical protein VV61_07995 [Staphylococcus carnosus]POA01419.1 hypothetical protein CD153_08010 [Staphylococcus carnosus]QQS85896.1 hypothetical protein I6J04_03655 [Staphylococcus carnosus]QRQ05831.1 hypothetical protein I6J34_03990 [Staphylococcus carnosus]UTB82174.1 hypothetical protein A2I67_02185 [Staphylococcus carnosus]